MVIQKYDPDWVNRFETLKNEIQKNLKTENRIYHIGSTSIPGMYAKPIIDMNRLVLVSYIERLIVCIVA